MSRNQTAGEAKTSEEIITPPTHPHISTGSSIGCAERKLSRHVRRFFAAAFFAPFPWLCETALGTIRIVAIPGRNRLAGNLRTGEARAVVLVIITHWNGPLYEALYVTKINSVAASAE